MFTQFFRMIDAIRPKISTHRTGDASLSIRMKRESYDLEIRRTLSLSADTA